MSTIRIGKRHLVPVTIAVALIAVIVLVFNAGHVKAQLNDWKLLPQPQRLTELYFTDHKKIPLNYYPGQLQTFTFDAHNIEYRRTTYTYQVTQQSEDRSQKQTLKTGTFSLNHFEYQTTTVSFVPSDMGGRSRITTFLTNKTTGQTKSIYYSVINPSAAPPQGAGI